MSVSSILSGNSVYSFLLARGFVIGPKYNSVLMVDFFKFSIWLIDWFYKPIGSKYWPLRWLLKNPVSVLSLHVMIGTEVVRMKDEMAKWALTKLFWPIDMIPSSSVCCIPVDCQNLRLLLTLPHGLTMKDTEQLCPGINTWCQIALNSDTLSKDIPIACIPFDFLSF